MAKTFSSSGLPVLIKNEIIVTDDTEIAASFNTYFINITDSLGLSAPDENHINDLHIMSEGFTLVDFAVPTREKPVSHQGVDSPICDKCRALELSFFDPTCPGCHEILLNPKTRISQIFAILRQWMPQTQHNIDVLIREIQQRGGHVNDRDGLTDMTMLHYACKSGAAGVGDATLSSETVQALIEKGADYTQKCRWTDMLPLHYATFFDVVPVMNVLLNASGSSDADAPCKEFDNGTPLHIACSNLCLKAAKCLLEHRANPNFKNGLGQIPRECLPAGSSIDKGSEVYSILMKMQSLLLDAENTSKSSDKESLNKATLHALGLAIGDTVYISGKRGILLYCGPTEFASGQWAGIALSEPSGKNDGSVGGVRYFNCKAKHGIFAPVSRVKKVPADFQHGLAKQSSNESADSTSSEIDSNLLERYSTKFQVGERVLVAGQKQGNVQFTGQTQFATGYWVGVELDEPSGKNDGSVAGVRYFQCAMNYGIFAPISKVEKIRKQDGLNSSRSQKQDADSPVTNIAISHRSPHSDADDSHRMYSTQSPNVVSDRKKGENVIERGFSSKLPTRRESPSPVKSIQGNAREAETISQISKQKPTETCRTSVDPTFKLKLGMSVYVNNELGITRYIGSVEFASGVWLGVELRKPSGKNDGAVGDRRYFTCKPNHGLMIRPSRATCRGINCARLLPAV
eukprot:Seg683.1_Seg683.6 transcript_id=Seg683.1_Seg683.6/GoldUCD/mRNA.D3Y31 product="CAP-Gly domain-containing linker protein 3" protein_id=Seg683.1_Seg683.6/GoldUCD/D3Y31